MRSAMLGPVALAFIATSATAQVPEGSQADKVEMGYRRTPSFRIDPFRNVMIPHWGLIVSAGATGENTVLNASDVGALIFIEDNDEILPGDVIDVLGLIPAGKGVRAVGQAEGGAHLGMNFGSRLSLGFSAQGRAYGSAHVSDSAVSLLRDGNLTQQDFNIGSSGGSGLATAEVGAHAVVRFGPLGGAEGANLVFGFGGRLVRPGAYFRARSEVGSAGTLRVTPDSVIADLAFETLLTPDDGPIGIEERFKGELGSGVLGDFLMRIEWPTQGMAFEAMLANIGTVTVKDVERDTASLFIATNDPRDDVADALDSLEFETRDSLDVDIRFPRILRFTASAWANSILQVDLAASMPVGGEFETPLTMDIGTTWRLLRHLPLRAGVILGGHQGLGYSGGFAIEVRNIFLQVAGQSLGGFFKQAKGVGARLDFGIFF